MKKIKRILLTVLSVLTIATGAIGLASCDLLGLLPSSENQTTSNNGSDHQHTYSKKTTAPTCTEQGYTAYTCSCGDSYVEDYVNANGHTEVIDQAVEPTCTETGLTEGKHCSVCSNVLEKQEVIKATGHSYKDKVCESCDQEYFSEGLEYASNGNVASCCVRGLGTCKDSDIVIPSKYKGLSVTSIWEDAFYDHDSLTSIEIPNSVTSIGKNAFYDCDGLTSIVIGDNVTSIGDRAFANCSNLTFHEYGNAKYLGTKENPYYAFIDIADENDGNFKLHANTKIIADSAFYNCSNLTSIEIPDSVLSIGIAAFSSCTNLTSITVDENNQYYKSINGNLYTKDGKTLIQYAIGKTDTSFTVPDGVTSIGEFAFFWCTGLTSVEISDGVTSIGEYAFSCCTGLTSVVIPNSVTLIDNSAFYACTGLTSVYYQGTEEEWTKISIYTTYNSALISAPRYYYSKMEPIGEGNYWHYDENGEVIVW